MNPERLFDRIIVIGCGEYYCQLGAEMYAFDCIENPPELDQVMMAIPIPGGGAAPDLMLFFAELQEGLELLDGVILVAHSACGCCQDKASALEQNREALCEIAPDTWVKTFIVPDMMLGDFGLFSPN